MMESPKDQINGKEEGKQDLQNLPPPAGSALTSGEKFRWLKPGAVLLTGVMLWGSLLLMVWLNIRGEYLRILERDLDMAAHHLKMRLTGNLSYLSLLMERGGAAYGEFGKRAENFLADHPELTALTLVDGQYDLIHRFPADSRLLPARIMEKLQGAGKSGQAAYTGVYGIGRGEGRFAALIPLESGERHLIAEYSLQGVLRYLLSPFSGGAYRMFLADASGRILSDVSNGLVAGGRIHGTLLLPPLGGGIRLCMTRQFEGAWALPPHILLHGFISLLFLIFTCGFALRLKAGNRFLAAEGRRYRDKITRLTLSRDKLALHLEKVRAVAEIQDQELSAARKRISDDAACMDQARLAVTALHNVGNAVNSLGITSSMIMERVLKSKADNIATVADIIEGHQYRLAEFFARDSIGSRLPFYLSMLARHLKAEKKRLSIGFTDMAVNIDYIAETVAGLRLDSWRNLGRVPVRVPDLLKDALFISGVDNALDDPFFHRRAKVMAMEVPEDPGPILLDRTRVLAILVGLMVNAGNEPSCRDAGEKVISFGMGKPHEKRIWIQVSDHGALISEEELERIERGASPDGKPGAIPFQTGKAAANEMGGSLSVATGGAGKGVTYILELPYQPVVSQLHPAPLFALGAENR